MTRPITLITGQWGDLSAEKLFELMSGIGYDGLELACGGDHFDVRRALTEDDYCEKKRAQLKKYNLDCWAISNHCLGQLVLDQIDERHKAIAPDYVWGFCSAPSRVTSWIQRLPRDRIRHTTILTKISHRRIT